MAVDTKVEALKELCAAIKTTNGETTTADQIVGNTVADIILEIAKIYGYKDASGVLRTLTLASVPGSTSGTTKITVTGGSGASLKYKIGSVTTPEFNEDLSSWTSWNGTSEITADDGVKISVAEVNGSGLAISYGATTVNANVG